MTPEGIKEGNKLIAEFMGVLITKRNGEDAVFMFEGAAYPEYFRVTKYNTYHEDLNMLMPVIEKIETYRLVYPKHADFVCDCKIVVLKHVLYREVVEFIKWYNSQLQQDNGTN